VCHGAVVDPTQSIAVRDLHVDGEVQVDLPVTCNGCHGTDVSGAPPPDVSGNTDMNIPSVGAHQAHLGTSIARPVPCSECHEVPADVMAEGHADSLLPAEVAFSGVAAAFSLGPEYSGGTCTNIYCHGDTKPYGGSVTEPGWTQFDGTVNTCASCHGVPPPPPHPDVLLCFQCHASMISPAFEILQPDLHINGEIDF
jgi:predicted CxxxxCH...CXXCH cytochrome family protein